ncbi:MAG: CapA family protein [Candidatus Nitrotoga sp.]
MAASVTIKRHTSPQAALLLLLMTLINYSAAQAMSCIPLVAPAALSSTIPIAVSAVSAVTSATDSLTTSNIVTAIPADISQAASAVLAVSSAIPRLPVRIMLTGDIVLGNSFVVQDIPKDWDQRYFAGVRDVLKQANLVIGNLEGVLTEHLITRKTTGTGRQFAFRSPPRYASLLKEEGFGVLNVANNHAYDFGEVGVRDTLAALEQAKITTAGVLGEIKLLNILGLNIAVLGYSYASWFNSILDLTKSAELVQQAKAQGAYVIVTFHAGAEGSSAIWHADQEEMFMGENRGNTVAFSRAMIAAGADMVVGHGPHVLRAAECYQGKPIIYSLGNFVGVGGLSSQKFAAVSALLDVSIGLNGAIQRMDLVPVRFNEQKLPYVDSQALGTRLVNYLGKHARYAGDFIEFSVNESGQQEFDAWYKANKRYAEPLGQ